MKRIMFVDAINNAWARLVDDEAEVVIMDVHLGTLYQFITDEVVPQDFLEIAFAEDQETVIGAKKLVEETQKRKQEAIAQHNRLIYGTSGANTLLNLNLNGIDNR
jgi:hypothetical protein